MSISLLFNKTDLKTPLLSDSSTTSPTNTISIFCDGACSKNGRIGARAGYGIAVFHGDVAVSKLSVLLGPDEYHSNQRAEIRALLHAIELVTDMPTTIYSDSKYSIECGTTWGRKWESNGWTKPGGPIQHLDIVKPLVAALRNPQIKVIHVAGHQVGGGFTGAGNRLADELARVAVYG